MKMEAGKNLTQQKKFKFRYIGRTNAKIIRLAKPPRYTDKLLEF
jgi:hypothetical protein